MARNYPAPAGLQASGEALWEDITALYDLRPDELRVLEAACREVDLIERLDEQLVGADLVVKGSQGQPVANPLVQELRQHRSALRACLKQLALPDEDGAEKDRSTQAREAAAARWKRTG